MVPGGSVPCRDLLDISYQQAEGWRLFTRGRIIVLALYVVFYGSG